MVRRYAYRIGANVYYWWVSIPLRENKNKMSAKLSNSSIFGWKIQTFIDNKYLLWPFIVLGSSGIDTYGCYLI